MLLLALPVSAAEKESPDRDLQVGFFLLRDVCHQELPLHLITMAKTTPGDVKGYVDRISKEATMSMSAIDAMEQRNGDLRLAASPLPNMEQEVRSSIRAEKQHLLLFGATGEAFARALLVTQIEASTYIVNLTKVMGSEDGSGREERSLARIGTEWSSIRDEGYRLLGKH